MKIAIFGNTFQADKLGAVAAFISLLSRHDDVELSVEGRFRRYLEAEAGLSGLSSTGIDGAQIALSLGGDGTFLATAHTVGARPIPIMGINTGHLGYLSAIGIDEAHTIVDDILGERYVVERRRLLKVSGPQLPHDFSPVALNEVAILKRDSASMITVDTTLNGEPLARYQADGLIIATPTGSTAYNLSVGGPIAAPGSTVWIISPIAPHSLTLRPLVVPDTSEIGIVAASRTPTFRLSVDGRSTSLPAGTPLTVTRAPHDTLLARPHGHDFLTSLRTKLLWAQ